MKTEFKIEITKLSGEVVLTKYFSSELDAQNNFDKLSEIKWPLTYEGLTMNLSEYPESRTGSVRLIVDNANGTFIRRELYRKP